MEPSNNPISSSSPTQMASGGQPPVEPPVSPMQPQATTEAAVPGMQSVADVTTSMPDTQPVVGASDSTQSIGVESITMPNFDTTPPSADVAATGVSVSDPVATPTASPTIGASPNPVFQPTSVGIAATDPIMTPEPAPKPDPVEAELNAPMKAMGPVPGSIGSAVSGPTDGSATPNMGTGDNPFATSAPQERTPNVSFNDPATMGGVSGATPTKSVKSKKNRITLIVLIAVASVVVVVLLVILVMQLMSGNNSTPPVNNNANNSSNSSNSQNQNNSNTTPVIATNTLSCTRSMNANEIAMLNDAISGTISVSAEFDDGALSQIALVKSVVYSDEDVSSNEPVEMEVHESTAEDLTNASAMTYYLPEIPGDGVDGTNYSLEVVQDNYEDLAFTCELL